MSRSASAAPLSPATVENRANIGVCLPIFEKNPGLGVAGDVVGHREGAVGSPAFGVHAPLRDHLPIECANFSSSQISWSKAGPRRPRS